MIYLWLQWIRNAPLNAPHKVSFIKPLAPLSELCIVHNPTPTGFFFVNGTHFAVSNLNYVPCTKPSLGGEGSRCITLLVLSPRVDCSSVIAMKKKDGRWSARKFFDIKCVFGFSVKRVIHDKKPKEAPLSGLRSVYRPLADGLFWSMVRSSGTVT